MDEFEADSFGRDEFSDDRDELSEDIPGMPDGQNKGRFDGGGVIAARGTGEGLVLRVDGRVSPGSLREAVQDFMVARRSFLSGNEVALEWVGHMPDENTVDKLCQHLLDDYGITVKESRMRERSQLLAGLGQREDATMPRSAAASVSAAGRLNRQQSRLSVEREVVPDESRSLFDGIEAMSGVESESDEDMDSAEEYPSQGRIDPTLWDEPDARVVYETLRSGQRLETEHSVIVLGDVNSGAEIVAGGDVVVLGRLRGVAHAGAYDETGGGRVIIAATLQPTQLRIGSVISRGSSEGGTDIEIARIDGNMIVVEPYHSRTWSRHARGK